MALTDKLTAIGNAIREKTGGTDKLTLDQMPSAISGITTGEGGGYEPTEEDLILSGDCIRTFSAGHFDWIIKQYGNRIKTSGLRDTGYMFHAANVESIPFDLIYDNTSYRDLSYIFHCAANLKEIADIVNAYPGSIRNMFYDCRNLRHLPKFINTNWQRINTYQYAYMSSMFTSCYALREIPEDLLKNLYNTGCKTAMYTLMYDGFTQCRNLNEIRGLSPRYGELTTNAFSSSFSYCCRIKELIFDTQEDGTPYTANWKSQTIDLSQYVGYYPNVSQAKQFAVTDFNTGITLDKAVYDDATYQALKDDPDWFTYAEISDPYYAPYCRYNHDSAVNTINSLPDTSAYLAEKGGTNTIKFKGAAGSATEGGAINTLTEEEIAVAVAKGWTVSFV